MYHVQYFGQTFVLPGPEVTEHHPLSTSLNSRFGPQAGLVCRPSFGPPAWQVAHEGAARTTDTSRRYSCNSNRGRLDPSPPAWRCSHKLRTDAACSRIGVDPLVFTTRPVHGSYLSKSGTPRQPRSHRHSPSVSPGSYASAWKGTGREVPFAFLPPYPHRRGHHLAGMHLDARGCMSTSTACC
ncbi:uncharacterized protein LY79DRAFT_310422 [Colletotrichum navitas]|uniref:Uncharacterized protein n=1 Tax=Colletotrichum navitas TaxID=681940 RepID=A0AAD8PU93_9PEZI|nr:uncharacterized protein LY79DRAFT_310422 [Colletotrichum navitas]KAK1580320.1 hypothetical protein LY79DRAFT_310422 [Colletotrichum navitas]